MRSLETINLSAILSGGDARTQSIEYARALASKASEIKDRPSEIDYNPDGTFTVRLVPPGAFKASVVEPLAATRMDPVPFESLPRPPLTDLPKPADHVVRDRQSADPDWEDGHALPPGVQRKATAPFFERAEVAEGLTPPYYGDVAMDFEPAVKVGEINVSGEASEDIMQPAGGGECFAVPQERRSGERRENTPRRRSEDFTLIGTYELVILGAGRDPKPHSEFRRLNLTSVPNHTLRDERQIELLTDALNTVACFEYDLAQEAVFSMLHADTFEEATDRRIT